MKKLCLTLFLCFFFVTLIVFVIFNFVVANKKYKNFVVKYSEEYNLEIALVYAIIKVESNFDKNAISSAGARGLMQLLPSTARWIAEELNEPFDEEKLFNEETNIKFGCFYLNYLFAKFKNLDAVVCAYNAGEGVVREWLDENGNVLKEKIAFEETKNYYSKIMKYYNIYKKNQIFE